MASQKPCANPNGLALLQTSAAAHLSPFTLSVLRECCAIPRGKVATYGQVATAVGKKGAFWPVSEALRANPFAPTVPCHRVLPASLRLVEADASGVRQKALLVAEGVVFDAKGRLAGAGTQLFSWPRPAPAPLPAPAPALAPPPLPAPLAPAADCSGLALLAQVAGKKRRLEQAGADR